MADADTVSNQPFSALDRTRGSIPSAAQHNQLVAAVERMQVAIRPPVQVFPNGGQAQGSVLSEQQFKLVEIFGDYITANPWNGVEANTDQTVFIAKPYLIRNSITSRNGKTYSTFSNASGLQQRSNDTDSETQVVIPTYVTDDIIYARTGIIGGTSVSYSVNGVDYPVVWLDCNDSRAWSKKSGS